MYLAKLSNQEQVKAFFRIATRMIKADGRVDKYELGVINAYLGELTISHKYTSEFIDSVSACLDQTISLSDESLLEDLSSFTGTEYSLKKALLFELISIAICDLEVTNLEQALYTRIADMLSIDKVDVEIIRDLVENFHVLVDKTSKFIG